MSDRVLVPLPGIGTLALSVEDYQAALAAGGAVLAAPAGSGAAADAEPLLGAEDLAAVLSVPVTRIESGARQGVIPLVRVGRYVRFRRSDVERALANGHR